MSNRTYTKKPMTFLSLRLPKRDLELLRVAATQEEISQSEFIRLALRERGARVIRELGANQEGAPVSPEAAA
jgi:hypothetical protein